MMGRKKALENKELKYLICARINSEKYRELEDIVSHSPYGTMSTLIRKILENRRIKVFTHDHSIDPTIKELAEIREKIKLTGIIINQHTKHFNTHTDLRSKEFYAKLAFNQFLALDEKIDRLSEIVSEQAKRWLNK
jgi:MobC-like protein